ncbi:hypothetical protein C8034_v012096 [Colletotrichum sidae]|uniref:Telomeric single stranded DNA binding POT1/Cdc13 domain-containing protein n=1 Tax=Colletotrichum sidae TaxID=1347389 RepID=A0A4R8TIA8_9PEZI|nr:hypothetical protein C8034_v012096 [Colletotrichum sidae]
MSGDQLPSQFPAAEGIPIAQLSPDVEDPKSRTVRGVVTITWPYSIINKTIAFLLAEPDFRLRRAKGQVRVEFSGPSAKAIRDSGLGSYDEIELSLDGVEFVTDDSKLRVPGTSLEWQLKFKNRLLLQAKVSDSEDVKLLDVDDPATEPEPEPEPASAPAPTLERLPDSVLEAFKEPTPAPLATPTRKVSSKRPADESLEADEYASPAFLKRARVSYGSLFEGSLDIFEEDIGAKARAKKREKSGRYSSVWRYTSTSRSPEPQPKENEGTEDTPMVDEQAAITTPSRPKMVDGGCQTVELERSPPRDVQVAAEARRDAAHFWQTPSKSTTTDSCVQSHLTDLMHTPLGTGSNSNDFGQPPPMPIFTSAHEHYTPAFEQPPLGPIFDQDIQQPLIDPQYHADSSFHEPSNAYPEDGLDQEMGTPGQYPAAFLETPNFDPQTAITSQPFPETMQARADHSSQGPHGMGAEHRTVLVDGIAEPQQASWGHAPAHSTPPARAEEVPGFDASAAGKQAGPAEKQPGTQAIPSDDWAEDRERQAREHHDDPDGTQAALKVDEDLLPEDHSGPEENFTAKTYAERHFESLVEREKEAADISQVKSSSTSDGSEDSEEEAEHEEDDAGGDYDITNYRNLSNVQDDDEATDLESDYGQEDEKDIHNPVGHGSEFDATDDDAEDYEGDEYGEEDEGFDDEDQENQPPPAAPAAPQVISLLSDSDDDEEDEAPPPPVTVQTRQLPPQDDPSSESEVEDQEEDPEDHESTDEVASQPDVDVDEGGGQISSSPVLSVEDSDDEHHSDGGTPTPKPREASNVGHTTRSLGSSSPQQADGNDADMTTSTIADDLETMSPVKLPHTMDVTTGVGSQPSSRGDSEILEAELERELEEEMQAGEEQKDQKPLAEPRTAMDEDEEQGREDYVGHETTIVAESDVKTTEGSGARKEATITPDDEDVDAAGSDGQVESAAEEVRNTPRETSVVEVTPEPANGAVSEPVDINMTDADDEAVDDAAGRLAEESETLVGKAETLVKDPLDEEQIIQSQLEDEAMVEEEMIIIETTQIIEQADLPAAELDDETFTRTSPETAEITIETSTVTQVTTIQGEDYHEDDPRDTETMDVDEPDTQSPKVASFPAGQQDLHSFEVAQLVETQTTQVSEVFDGSQHQLSTPADTQMAESFTSTAIVDIETEERSTDKIKTTDATVEKSEETVDPTPPTVDEPSQIRDGSAQPSEARSPLIAEEVSEETNAAPIPRRVRGHRRNKSASRDQDPSVKLARASIAARRSTRLSDRTTPEHGARATRARSHSLVLKSDSPDADEDADAQLARAANESPSRAAGKEAKEAAAPESPSALKMQLNKSLRVDVAECISLKALRNHPGKAIDVIAIATTEPPEARRAKGGPRGIVQTINVTDQSTAPTLTVPVQIFRSHKSALPVVHPGDAILLRHFNIVSMTGRGFGLRANDGSSWAVFERKSEDGLPQIRGPPVELTEGETSHAALLKQWYAGLDAKALAKVDKANEAVPAMDTGKE